MNKKSINYKICLSGDSGVGKSSIVRKYIHNQFENYSEATIGAAFFSRDVEFEDYTLKLQIWDTAGQERYRSLGPLYYRGCKSIILVINGIETDSLEKSHSWIKEIRYEVPEVYIILAVNKSDLDLVVSEEALKEVCQNYGHMDYIHVSAKSGNNIEKLFEMSFQHNLSIEEEKNVILVTESKKQISNSWCSII